MSDRATVTQALALHTNAASGNEQEAPDSVLAALQSLYTLKSTPAGVTAILEEGGSLAQLCRVLRIASLDCEAAKLVLDMLTHILIYSSAGYCCVIKVGSLQPNVPMTTHVGCGCKLAVKPAS